MSGLKPTKVIKDQQEADRIMRERWGSALLGKKELNQTVKNILEIAQIHAAQDEAQEAAMAAANDLQELNRAQDEEAGRTPVQSIEEDPLDKADVQEQPDPLKLLQDELNKLQERMLESQNQIMSMRQRISGLTDLIEADTAELEQVKVNRQEIQSQRTNLQQDILEASQAIKQSIEQVKAIQFALKDLIDENKLILSKISTETSEDKIAELTKMAKAAKPKLDQFKIRLNDAHAEVKNGKARHQAFIDQDAQLAEYDARHAQRQAQLETNIHANTAERSVVKEALHKAESKHAKDQLKLLEQFTKCADFAFGVVPSQKSRRSDIYQDNQLLLQKIERLKAKEDLTLHDIQEATSHSMTGRSFMSASSSIIKAFKVSDANASLGLDVPTDSSRQAHIVNRDLGTRRDDTGPDFGVKS